MGIGTIGAAPDTGNAPVGAGAQILSGNSNNWVKDVTQSLSAGRYFLRGAPEKTPNGKVEFIFDNGQKFQVGKDGGFATLTSAVNGFKIRSVPNTYSGPMARSYDPAVSPRSQQPIAAYNTTTNGSGLYASGWYNGSSQNSLAVYNSDLTDVGSLFSSAGGSQPMQFIILSKDGKSWCSGNYEYLNRGGPSFGQAGGGSYIPWQMISNQDVAHAAPSADNNYVIIAGRNSYFSIFSKANFFSNSTAVSNVNYAYNQYSTFRDKNTGYLWFAAANGNILQYTGGTSLTSRYIGINLNIYAVSRDSTTNKWVLSTNGGVYIYDDGGTGVPTNAASSGTVINSSITSAMIEELDGKIILYAGNYNSVAYIVDLVNDVLVRAPEYDPFARYTHFYEKSFNWTFDDNLDFHFIEDEKAFSSVGSGSAASQLYIPAGWCRDNYYEIYEVA